MSASTPKRVYRLKESVRIFSTNAEEIRFRKGVWNFNEAVLRLSGQDPRSVSFLREIVGQLSRGNTVDFDQSAQAHNINATELDELCEVLENLRHQQFLELAADRSAANTVSALLGGGLSGFETHAGVARPVVFFTDSSYARSAAEAIAKEVELPMDMLDDDMLGRLTKVDLTSRVEALELTRQMEDLQRHFAPYSCVIGCLGKPNISMLRNLNWVLVKTEKPLILGLIDGPFATVLSMVPRQSGCFECYEQRLLARLEDTLAYNQYVREMAQAPETTNSNSAGGYAPALHILAGAVISEAFLYASLSVLRLAGRAISVYLPLLEVQVQDLLRVPYCPGCGFIATAQMKEMYTSSRRLVGDMVARVEVKRG